MSKKKYNQHRSKLSREHGHEYQDWNDKDRVMRHMKSKGWKCQVNMFLMISKLRECEYKFSSLVLECELAEWRLGANIDVLCTHPDFVAPLLIEIDGAVHRKELDCRELYTELKLPHIILNKEFLHLEQIEWEEWIDDQMLVNLKLE